MTDVAIPQHEWLALRHKALFFIPEVIRKFDVSQLTQADVVKRSQELEEPIGPPVIRSVLLSQPVSYKKARGTLDAYNSLVSEELVIDYRYIIGCVFRIRDLATLMRQIGTTVHEISRITGLSESCVENVARGGRVHYVGSKLIEDALASLDRGRSLLPRSPLMDPGSGGTKAIYQNEDDESPSMIRFEDLREAPLYGHRWALENR